MFIEKVTLAGVVTLNEIALPLLTLMSVEKPWIVASPDPDTSHSDGGLPGCWFSAGIGLLLCAVSGPSTKEPVTKRVPPRSQRSAERRVHASAKLQACGGAKQPRDHAPQP